MTTKKRLIDSLAAMNDRIEAAIEKGIVGRMPALMESLQDMIDEQVRLRSGSSAIGENLRAEILATVNEINKQESERVMSMVNARLANVKFDQGFIAKLSEPQNRTGPLVSITVGAKAEW